MPDRHLLQVLALIAVLKVLYVLDHLTKPILLPGRVLGYGMRMSAVRER